MRRVMPRVVVVLLLSASLMACAGGGDPSEQGRGDGRDRRSIIVGSFNHDESRILAELYARVLEARGYPVERAFEVGPREVVEPALEQGVIDFVPEYVGTALIWFTRDPGRASPDPGVTRDRLQAVFLTKGITLLALAPAQSQNRLAVTRKTAEDFRLSRVSDLRPVAPEMVLGGPPECPERLLCLIGLRQTYGLEFKRFDALDVGGPITVTALETGQVDVAQLFTTDPNIASKDFVLLEDDRSLQPAENVVPAVRDDVIRAHGQGFVEAADSLSRQLGTEDLAAMRGEVELKGRQPGEVAADWLDRKGLLP